jgi:hypothetical protein
MARGPASSDNQLVLLKEDSPLPSSSNSHHVGTTYRAFSMLRLEALRPAIAEKKNTLLQKSLSSTRRGKSWLKIAAAAPHSPPGSPVRRGTTFISVYPARNIAKPQIRIGSHRQIEHKYHDCRQTWLTCAW